MVEVFLHVLCRGLCSYICIIYIWTYLYTVHVQHLQGVNYMRQHGKPIK